MKTETCRNTEKQVFTMPYPLSVPDNVVDRPGPPDGRSAETPDLDRVGD